MRAPILGANILTLENIATRDEMYSLATAAGVLATLGVIGESSMRASPS